MAALDSRGLFWAVPLVAAPLVTWGLSIFLADDLGLLKGDSALVFGLVFPVLLTVGAGLLTRRSWEETLAGTTGSLVMLLVLVVVLFLMIPEDTFQ